LEVRGCSIKGNFFSILILRRIKKRRTMRTKGKSAKGKKKGERKVERKGIQFRMLFHGFIDGWAFL
jgi:hypothetical protein